MRTRLIWLAVVIGCAAALLPFVVSADSPGRVLSRLSGGRLGSQAADWHDWNPSHWAREAPDFSNPVIKGLWDPERMRKAGSADQPVANDVGKDEPGVSDPEPKPNPARAVSAPYHDSAPIVGKLFFDSPQGPSVCSATVVTDPAQPGASDLVWTAGHCVHAGAKGGWFRNLVFVPSYNDRALEGAARGAATADQVAPFGVWWADWAQTSPQWIAEGEETGGKGSPFDFAVLHVRRKTGTGPATLEQTVGGAARVNFSAPATKDIDAMSLWGYPAAAPFDGERMFTCAGRPGRLSINSAEPSLYRVGCTMTGGSSGGGWFVRASDGTSVLVSNTSIGPSSQTWLAGPRLGKEAEDVYSAVSGRFA
ncbi:hypothetical protein SAMN05216251_115133 [Actinacidiphila alni]|uniref:Serine protease n=1 Tax=Actinacidiphila alni TaxID=380248 RepID=A0A1I2J4I8_9ACTN|nr:hypothetical protein [Actinacidiphila alni]SFF47651.1 hypothetical protein SAMN05216251_115133 [Actinacidiphila alni]